ncbi:uncharacterized protein Bfra_006607 [Botrytis fragariae]|uniref:OB domain-containing protein n=1 Tax=Botrytis fragariae TaxID=1964551 RepID=A0A8H6B4R3_9HELO|nr:uncharacterized protein Bfra_006607 [Botrytis fragariae]KAF5879398.1 hypothetical protein Bfra_006607 [Botrytis fragariae]
MPPKIIFLTGAPTYHSLGWDESKLQSDFTEPFIQFLHLPHPYPNSAPRNNNTSVLEFSIAQNAEWRELPLERKHLTTGASQDHAFQPLYGEVDGVLSQFYEHSYAIHDIPSSQITSSDFDSTSYSTSGYDSQSLFPQSGKNTQVPVTGYLTNLKDMPHAQHLSSIVPQTMTVNLIVGIISISEPRAISTRQGGDVSLVEILVGDETKSGFSINFWLSGKGKEEVQEVLENLRVQDIVLMKNVALGSFRGKVHGQSLRKDMTKAWLMYREKIDRSDVGGCYGRRDLERKEIDVQLAKVKRVRDWVVGFVGVATTNRRGVKRVREELPPDTQ